DILDPYFFMRFDVYANGQLPSADMRIQSFHFAGGFESSPFHNKDRFLVQDIPVRVDYKGVAELPQPDQPDSLVRFISREEGTYPMFRIAESQLIYSTSDWFSQLQERLNNIDACVWNTLVDFFMRRVEHHLADYGAAVYRDDIIFQRIALAGFIRGLSSALFAINRRFEPSARGIMRLLFDLAELPEGFDGRFQVLLEDGQNAERRFEIADMLTRSTLNLVMAHEIL
ncbi:MAG: DUF4037 domain-containing protein, partial [Spirochaetaceae bacterium]